VLRGGAEPDTLYPQDGRDRVYGDAGADQIRASDGQRDVVRCGPGNDTAWVDRGDVRSGCEFVEVFPGS
jgi:Ca2+-binding RTX toxin-like protein